MQVVYFVYSCPADSEDTTRLSSQTVSGIDNMQMAKHPLDIHIQTISVTKVLICEKERKKL